MTETKSKPEGEFPALSVNYIEYGRVFNLREHRNERIKIGAVIDSGQISGEQGMILLFEKVERLHNSFDHWRRALGQVLAAKSNVESKERAIQNAKQNVEDQKLRAEELRAKGKKKQSECALEEIDTLEARVKEAKKELNEAMRQYHLAIKTKNKIANALRKGTPDAALDIPLDPKLPAYDVEAPPRYDYDY